MHDFSKTRHHTVPPVGDILHYHMVVLRNKLCVYTRSRSSCYYSYISRVSWILRDPKTFWLGV